MGGGGSGGGGSGGASGLGGSGVTLTRNNSEDGSKRSASKPDLNMQLNDASRNTDDVGRIRSLVEQRADLTATNGHP
eukprot:3121612-Prymnesium_polylepis.1